MAVFKCKMCGGTLDIQGNETIATCEYCGGKQTLPQAKDEIIQNLFNRANALRLKCEFDKAEQIYEKILQQDNTDPEAHWGIILCKYGIEYVEDPKTFKRIPTCHRTSYDAITADADYLAAIENADTLSKNIYADEAKAIDEIQNKILNVVKNEKPFDVFICYKESDENGKRTVDSSIANDIYYQLTQEGLKVFYAAITLEDKIGQEYEPYIFAALTSAKVMLVIGTKPEYFNAVWVKNEWSRYIKQMKNDRSKLLIPCYKDMDAYELPEEFAHLQAQDISKIGFINDIVRGIKKVTANSEAKPATVEKETVVTSGSTNIAPLLKRAFMFLEDGEFSRADDFCEQVLNQDPENAQAYLGKLLAELKVKTKEELKDCGQPFDDRNYYKKALRFADDNLKNELVGFIEYINTRNENARLESIYNRATEHMVFADCEADYKKAADIFNSIREYKDAASLADELLEKAEAARRDSVLKDAEEQIKRGEMGENAVFLDIAIKKLRAIDWMDVTERIDYCQKKIEEIKAKRLERERKEEEERKAEKRSRTIITIIVCAIIGLSVLGAAITPILDKKKNPTIDGIKYESTERGYVVAEYSGLNEEVIILSEVNGKPVVAIGEWAFSFCDGLTSITIPNSVTTIGDSAFSFCDSLTSITIPNSVVNIGGSAFYSCEKLTSIIIPTSVTTIGDSAFSYCDSLTTIIIPDSVTTIGEWAFYKCSGLTSVTIGKGVMTIEACAFGQCANIEKVIFEDASGWYVNPNNVNSNKYDTALSTLVYVSSEKQAAEYLTGRYASYYWYKK